MLNDLAQFILLFAIMTALAVIMGKWLTRVFTQERGAMPERWTYALLGVDPGVRMSWKHYGLALLISNASIMLLGYVLLRVQALLPFDSLQRAAQSPDLAFNTAASFRLYRDKRSEACTLRNK